MKGEEKEKKLHEADVQLADDILDVFRKKRKALSVPEIVSGLVELRKERIWQTLRSDLVTEVVTICFVVPAMSANMNITKTLKRLEKQGEVAKTTRPVPEAKRGRNGKPSMEVWRKA